MIKLIILLGIASVINITETARILAVYPCPSISHQVVFRVITNELVKRGHEVVVITPNPEYPKDKTPVNLTEIDVHDVSYNFYDEIMSTELAKLEFGKMLSYVDQVKAFNKFMNLFQVQLKANQVQKLIPKEPSKEFDLLLIEPFIMPMIIFSHFFKAPVIQVSSFGAMIENLETIGAPTHPFLYPIPYRKRLYGLSRWEKIREFFYYLQHKYYLHSNDWDKVFLNMFGSNIPPFNNLMNNVDMVFLNVHPIWMDNMPVPPGVVFMGGLHQKPRKELPSDLKSYLDSSKRGVVYVSFGTNVHPKLLDQERVKVFVETLSELNYDVLFKWTDELPIKASNIKVSKWLPQSDLLRHKNIKAFITQGGLQSTDEAITAAVPLVCIPMLGDQWYNAEKYVKLKIGIKLDFFEFTKAQLKDAVETVIVDKSVILQIDAANILAVFPTPSISHQIVFRPLTQGLAKRGHNVTVITTDPAFQKGETPKNFTEFDVHNISYPIWRSEIKNIMLDKENGMLASANIFKILNIVMEQQLRSREIQTLIADKHTNFDLIISEMCVPTSLIFSHIYKSPAIQISSFGQMAKTFTRMGAPNHPILQPFPGRRKIYNLSLLEKFYEFYQEFKSDQIDIESDKEFTMMLKNVFGSDAPTIEELYANVDMVFLNVNIIWNDNTPVPPGIIHVGGLHLKPEKVLPQEFQYYLDNSKFGVIYVSFGTNVPPSVLPPHQIEMMLKTLSKLPYDVIWKWNLDLPCNYSNVKVVKWVQQSDILRHKNLKPFITQGGLQSTDEAIIGGVPLIGIPIYGDQFYNAQKYVRHGIGKQLDIDTVTEQEFKDAVVTVITDQSYRNSIIKLRNIILDQPQTPLERAIWWTEYVLRHGGAKHLRAPAANMSWAEYYELNLVLIVLTCLLAIVSSIFVTFCYLWRFISKFVFLSSKLKVA